MALRPVSDEQDPRLAAAALQALAAGGKGPWAPSILDLLPVPAGVRRQAPAQVPLRAASAPQGARIAAPAARTAGAVRPTPSRRITGSPAISITQQAAEGLGAGAELGLTTQALRALYDPAALVEGLAMPSIQQATPQRELDRLALAVPTPGRSAPAQMPEPGLSWGEAYDQIAADLAAGRTEGMGAGAARAIGEGAGQVLLDPLGDALAVAGLGFAADAARRTMAQRAAQAARALGPEDAARVAKAEYQLGFLGPLQPTQGLPPAPSAQALRIPGAAQVSQAAGRGLDAVESGLQAVAPYARRLAQDESGEFQPWTPRGRRGQGPDLPGTNPAFNARNWRDMEPQAQDRVRDFMAQAANELELVGLGPHTRMSAETVQRMARAMTPEEVEALSLRHSAGDPLNIVETRAAQLALEDLNERATAITRRLAGEPGAITQAEESAMRQELANLDRQQLQLAKSIGFSETEKGRALSFLNVFRRRGFDTVYWLRQADRSPTGAGGLVPDEARARIVDITRRGQALERELEAIDPNAVTAARQRVADADAAAAPARAELDELAAAEREAANAEKKAGRDQTQADFNAIMGRLEEAQTKKAEAEARAQAVAAELAELRAAEAEAARAAKSADKAEVQADFNAIMGRLEEARAAKAEAEARLAEARAEIQALKQQEAELRRLERELERERARLERERGEAPGRQRRREEVEAELTGVRSELQSLLASLDVATPLETLATLRKAGLLTGAGTTVRNNIGNLANIGLEELARLIAGANDAASVGLGVASQRAQVAPSLRMIGRALHEGATRGWREADEVMRYGATAADLRNADSTMEFYSGRPIIDGYINTVFRFMSAQDRFYRAYAFRRSIDEVAAAEALNWQRAERAAGRRPTADQLRAYRENLQNNPTEAMTAEALWSSERAVFANKTAMGEGVSNLKAKMRANARLGSTPNDVGFFLADAVLPFSATPSAIYSRTMEYTPFVGQVFDPRRSSLAARRKVRPTPSAMGITPQEMRYARMLAARQMIGAGVMSLGFALGERGRILPGYNPNDKDRDKTAGMAPSSILIGDAWVPLNPFAPAGLMLMLGAQLAHASGGDMDLADVPLGVASIATDLSKTPMLQGVAQIAAAITTPSDEGKLAAISNYIGQVAGSFVPSFVADASRWSDPIRRDARAGVAFDNPQLASVAARVASRVPGLREMLPPALDAFGRARLEPGGFPGLVVERDRRRDPVVNQMLQLGAPFPRERKRIGAGDAATLSGSPNIELSPEQRNELAQMTGALAYNWLWHRMTADDWAQLDDTARRDEVDDIIHDAMAAGLQVWRTQNATRLGMQAIDAQERERTREERRRAQGLPQPMPFEEATP